MKSYNRLKVVRYLNTSSEPIQQSNQNFLSGHSSHFFKDFGMFSACKNQVIIQINW